MVFKKGNTAWNKGLTKEIDPRVALYGKNSSKTKKEKKPIAWNKGLTKETDQRVAKYSESSKNTKIKTQYHKGHPYYGGGPKIGHDVSEEMRKTLSIKSLEQWKNMSDKEKELKIRKMCSGIKRTRTGIEIKLEKFLNEMNINFISQKHIKLQKYHTDVDAFIEPNICIYADGCYHHACEIHHPNSKFIYKRDTDIKQTKQLEELGYVVLRFWGHEINKEPEKVKDKIKLILK
jgi:DNA mismatch endonuclease (patch repair protein)